MNHKSFCLTQNIDYREIVMEDGVFNKFYEINNPDCQEIKAIPDGCVDIEFVWKGASAGVYACGSALSSKISGVGTYDRCFGIRFNPGSIPACFQKVMNQIVNNRYDLKEFIDIQDMLEPLSKKTTLEEKVEYFLQHYKVHQQIEPNVITSFIIKAVKEESGYINISELVNTTGYSHCYVDRIFKNHVGISVKKYASIVRLQKAIEIVKERREDEIYEKLGFYDQAHFIHEFKRFTSVTPTVFHRMSEMSIV